jgi:FeS assembly protein IscX
LGQSNFCAGKLLGFEGIRFTRTASVLMSLFPKCVVKSVTIKKKYMSENPLYWDASYEIVLALMATYPETDVEEVGTQQLYRMIVELPNFADDPALVNDGILNDILREWYEEYTN